MPDSPQITAASADAAVHLRPRRVPGIVLLIFGSVLLGSSVLWLNQDQHRPATFGPPVNAATLTEISAPPGVSTPPMPSDDTGMGTPLALPGDAVAQSMPAATPAPVAVVGTPARLTISTLTVDAEVDPVFSTGGVLHPPDDPLRVGWWIGSSPAGSNRGSTVIVGHVDSAAAGPGALFRLTDLQPGTEISLSTADDNTVRYAVAALADYPKTGDLPAELFRSSGPPQLTVITCGGDFDAATASYADNIVVTALPIL